jgi:acetyl esterase/lipase
VETVRWIVCAVLAGMCSHGESNDRNKLPGLLDDVVVTRDVAYAPGDRHRLDIYAPRRPGGPRPVIVYLYGGAWRAGAKADYAWVGAAFARRGFVAVIPDYRVYPQVVWPKFLQDNASAVRWVRDHASSYGGDPSSVVLVGHSAGAFNAASLAVDSRWLSGVGMDPQRDLKAVVSLSGPYMGLPMNLAVERAIFSVGHGYTEPIDYVDGRSPPLLFLAGDKDRIADPHENDQLLAKVRKKGGVATIIHYPSFGHDDTQAALVAAPGRASAPVMEAILHFLAKQGVIPPPS